METLTLKIFIKNKAAIKAKTIIKDKSIEGFFVSTILYNEEKSPTKTLGPQIVITYPKTIAIIVVITVLKFFCLCTFAI